MARTRAGKGAGKAAPSRGGGGRGGAEGPTASRYILPAESSNPPKVLILPDGATTEARVVSLTHPRYSKPSRYLICPDTGAYEFTRISAPRTTPRSWLFEGADPASADAATTISSPSFETQVTRSADLYLATPIDPLFLALPALTAQFSATDRRMFLSSDDHLDTVGEAAPHLRDMVVRWPAWRRRLESRMTACCDTAEAGDETMFRFSEDKLFAEVLAKARRMARGGLPGSMEDRFVVKALEAPVLGVKRTMAVGSGGAAVASLQSEESAMSEGDGSQLSAATITTTATSASDASTAATSVAGETMDGAAPEAKDVSSAMQASEEVVGLQRLRVAFNFICSSYVPAAMASVLKKMLEGNKGHEAVDFGPLDDYVAQLTKLRQEATMARSALDYSRKRALDEEDEDRREKRRKKEEEEKRKKAGESRGVRELKKVNTAGMQKLSAFFKPKGSS